MWYLFVVVGDKDDCFGVFRVGSVFAKLDGMRTKERESTGLM